MGVLAEYDDELQAFARVDGRMRYGSKKREFLETVLKTVRLECPDVSEAELQEASNWDCCVDRPEEGERRCMCTKPIHKLRYIEFKADRMAEPVVMLVGIDCVRRDLPTELAMRIVKKQKQALRERIKARRRLPAALKEQIESFDWYAKGRENLSKKHRRCWDCKALAISKSEPGWMRRCKACYGRYCKRR